MNNTHPANQVNQKISNSKKYFSGGIVAFQVILGKIFHSSSAGLFLSQAIYWSDKGQGKEEPGDGWFYKSRDEWWDETSLSYDEQLTARMKLKSAGVLEEHNKKLIHRLYYRVNFDALDSLIDRYHDNPPKSGKSPETGKALLGGFQQVSSNLNILETSSQQSEGVKSKKPPISSLSPETGNPLVGEREIPSSYTHRLSSKTTKKEYIYNEYEVLNFFEDRSEADTNNLEPNYLDPNHKFDLDTLDTIRARSNIDDKSLITLILKFIQYYTIGKGSNIAGSSLTEWDKILSVNWIDNYHKFNKPEKNMENPIKEELDISKSISLTPKEHIEALSDPEEKTVKESLLNEYGEATFKSWFSHLSLITKSNDSWSFKVPSNFIKDWMDTNYLKDIIKAVRAFIPTVKSVDIIAQR